MKFLSVQLLSLFTATASFAFPTLFGDDVPIFGELSEGCLSASKQYEKCYAEITLSNLGSACASFKSEECQKFKNNGYLLGVNECKSEPQERVSFANDIIELMYIDAKFRCTNDENGNLCPINEYELKSKSRNDYEQSVKDTCKSKICSDAYVEFVNEFDPKLNLIQNKIENEFDKKLDNELNEMEKKIDEDIKKINDKYGNSKNVKLIKRLLSKLDASSTSRRDYLISNNCSNIPAKNTGNATSDATVVQKLNPILIVVVFIIATLI